MKPVEHKAYSRPHPLILYHIGPDVQVRVWDGVCDVVHERVVRLLRACVRSLLRRSS